MRAASAIYPPRLTKLRLTQDVLGSTDAVSFLSPSVRELHVVFRAPPSANVRKLTGDSQIYVDTLMKDIARRAPSITYLRITRTDGIPEPWLFPIHRFADLKTLDVLDPVYGAIRTPIMLFSLADLHNLHTLKLRLPSALCGSLEVKISRLPLRHY